MNRFVPLILLWQFTLLPAAEPFSRLDDAARLALTRNPSIQAARARWNAMRARVPQAAAWEDLEIGADFERTGTTRLAAYSDIEYMASQTIPVSGRNRVQARIAAAEAAVAFHEYRRVELDVVARVRAAWYKLGSAHAQLAFNQADAESLAQIIETGRVRYQSRVEETGGIGEVLNAELELGKVQESQLNLERRAVEATAELNGLLGNTAADRFSKVTLPPIGPRLSNDFERRALENRPEIWIAKEKAVSGREQVELAKRNWIPDPQLRVEARQFNGGIREYDTGIFFKVPWANQEKYKAAEEQAAFNQESSRHDLEGAQIQARALIRAQLAKIEASAHHAAIYREKLIPLARQASEAQRVGWETGRSGLRELLASTRSQRELQMQLAEHESDYLAAVAELNAIVGEPSFPPDRTKPPRPETVRKVKGVKP